MGEIYTAINPYVAVGGEYTKREGAPGTGSVVGKAGATLDVRKAPTSVVGGQFSVYAVGGGGSAKPANQGTTPIVKDMDGMDDYDPWGNVVTTPESEGASTGTPMPDSYGFGSAGVGGSAGLDFLIDGRNKDGRGVHITSGWQGEVRKEFGSVPVEDYAGTNPLGWSFMTGPNLGIGVDAGPVRISAQGYYMFGPTTSQITSGVAEPFDEVSSTWRAGGTLGAGLNLSGLGTQEPPTPKDSNVSDVRLTDEYITQKVDVMAIDTVTGAQTPKSVTKWEIFSSLPQMVITEKGLSGDFDPANAEHQKAVAEYLNALLIQIETLGLKLPGNIRGLVNDPITGLLTVGKNGELLETLDGGKTKKVKVDLFEENTFLGLGNHKNDALGLKIKDHAVIDFDDMNTVIAFIALLNKIIEEGSDATQGAQSAFSQSSIDAMHGATGGTATAEGEIMTVDITKCGKTHVKADGTSQALTTVKIKHVTVPATAAAEGTPATAAKTRFEVLLPDGSPVSLDGKTPLAFENVNGDAAFEQLLDWLREGRMKPANGFRVENSGLAVMISSEVDFTSGQATLTDAGKAKLDRNMVKPLVDFITANKDTIKEMATASGGQPVFSFETFGFASKDAFGSKLSKDYVLGGKTYPKGTVITDELSHELNWILANLRADALAEYVNAKLKEELKKLELPENAVTLTGHDYPKPANEFKQPRKTFTGEGYDFYGDSKRAEVRHTASASSMTLSPVVNSGGFATDAIGSAKVTEVAPDTAVRVGDKTVTITLPEPLKTLIGDDKAKLDGVRSYYSSKAGETWTIKELKDGKLTINFSRVPEGFPADQTLALFVKVKAIGAIEAQYIKVVIAKPVGTATPVAQVGDSHEDDAPNGG